MATQNGRLALAAALALAADMLMSVAVYADAALFNQRCAKCHSRASTVAVRLKGKTAEEKASHLDAFLNTHYAREPEVREKLVAYLVGLSSK